MQKYKITKDEFIEKGNHKIKRYPNLNTVLMVETFLENHKDLPMKISQIRTQLPKQVMHQTLKIILEYLWKSGKIIYGPKGIQWVYSEPQHLKEMFRDTLEI